MKHHIAPAMVFRMRRSLTRFFNPLQVWVSIRRPLPMKASLLLFRVSCSLCLRQAGSPLRHNLAQPRLSPASIRGRSFRFHQTTLSPWTWLPKAA